MLADKPDSDDRFVLSGYVANLMTCTPTWRPIGVKMHDDHMVRNLSFRERTQQKHDGQSGSSIEDIESVERGEILLQTNPTI